MTDLIKINYGSDRPTVLGRDLHAALEVQTPYDKWFPRMCEYGFADGTDFSTFLSESTGGRPATDHQLTIAMAKEISMLQRTERGKMCRQYFISIEESWNDPRTLMARALQAADAQIKQLTAKVEADAPKVLFASAVETSARSILVGELAKLIRQNGVEIGQTRLFRWLRDNGYMMKNRNIPTQYSMERCLMEIKETVINMPDGTLKTTLTPKITGKGQTYFVNKFLGRAEPGA